MAYDNETGSRLESLYREHLEEAFRGALSFDPITAEPAENMWDLPAFHLTVVHDGDGNLLDPAKLNRISSIITGRAAELGVDDTIIESHVHNLEYTRQREFVNAPLPQAGGNRTWHELLDLAGRFLTTGNPPAEAALKSAVDRCYFAMFHALCHSNAQALAGTLRNGRPADWSRVYMGMDENTIAPRFRQHRPQAPDPVNDFGAAFAILQEHRDRAMERFDSTFHPSEVAQLMRRAESAITTLSTVGAGERRSLAINLLVGRVRAKGRNTGMAPGPSLW